MRKILPLLVALALTISITAHATPNSTPVPNLMVDYNALNLDPTPNLWDCARTNTAKDLAKHSSARNRKVTKPVLINETQIINYPSPAFAAYEDFSKMQECALQVGSPGLALGDVDNDGRTDIVKASTLLLNKKTGWVSTPLGDRDDTPVKEIKPSSRFSQQWTGVPVIADLDNDNQAEIIIQRETQLTSSPFEIFAKVGNTWVNQTKERNVVTKEGFNRGVSLTVADFNRDGWLDIVLGRRLTITESAYNRRMDVNPTPISLWINKGVSSPGSFTEQTNEMGINSAFKTMNIPDNLRGFNSFFNEYDALTQSILAADIDNNNYTDILVMGDGGQSALLLNSGGSSFNPVLNFPRGPSAMGASLMDVDRNGLIDIFISNINGDDYIYYHCPTSRPCDTSKIGNQLLLQVTPGEFVDKAYEYGVLNAGWSWASAFVDLLNNNKHYLIVANGYGPSQSPRYEGWRWRIGETKVFAPTLQNKFLDITQDTTLSINDATSAVQADDINLDGKLDLILTSFRYRQPLIVINSSPKTGNFIKIKAKGKGGYATNVDGRGVVIKIEASGVSSYYEIGANSTFTSNGSNVIFAGIGVNQTAKVTAFFPATSSSVSKTVKANSMQTFLEP
ncbi:MAG: FG-GAP repeat domain-containing protein [Candidatus Paceibacterota bacterium]